MAKSNPNKAVEVRGEIIDPTTPEGRAKMAELTTAAIRMRNHGATMWHIADKLGCSEEDASHLVTAAVVAIRAVDTEEIAARHMMTLADIKRAMYPSMEEGDEKAANVLIKAIDHEAKMYGTYAPKRVHLGLDQEEFESTVEEDLRRIGVDPNMDTPLDVEFTDEDGQGWANT